MALSEKSTGLILDPNGQPATIPTILLTGEQARILREYKKKVLAPLGLKEALYCDDCWEHNLSHGTEAHVTDSQILIRCRCKLRFHQGQTY